MPRRYRPMGNEPDKVFARAETAAKDAAAEEKERRDQVLLADQQTRGLARNERLVGSIREVLVEGPSLRNAARWSGRDSGNRIVVWDVGENGKWKSEKL